MSTELNLTNEQMMDGKQSESLVIGGEHWRDAFTKEEVRDLLRVNNWRSAGSFVINWGLTGASFAAVIAWPNVVTVLAALFVIGGRQLGMSVLMHEAAHRTLFTNRKANDFFGNWFAAFPVWADLGPYRNYHLKHHAHTWTEKDPDLGLSTPFPITRDSLKRKIWRDLSGQTGWKRFRATLRRDLSLSNGKSGRQGAQSAVEAMRGVVITNLAMLAVLTAIGHPALYLLWIGAWFTTYSLLLRIRAIAEHSMVSDPANPLQNSRTTIVPWWQRLIFAPNYVNYHLEHHLLMTVPHHNLARMHRMMNERGLLGNANVMYGYGEVLEKASSQPVALGTVAA